MTIASPSATASLPVGKAAGSLAAGIANLAAFVRARFERARDQRELRALSDEQLADIGVSRAAIEPPRPAVKVEGALMRRLMSMS